MLETAAVLVLVVAVAIKGTPLQSTQRYKLSLNAYWQLQIQKDEDFIRFTSHQCVYIASGCQRFVST